MEAIGMGQERLICKPGMTPSCHASSDCVSSSAAEATSRKNTLPFSSSILSAQEGRILNPGYNSELSFFKMEAITQKALFV